MTSSKCTESAWPSSQVQKQDSPLTGDAPIFLIEPVNINVYVDPILSLYIQQDVQFRTSTYNKMI